MEPEQRGQRCAQCSLQLTQKTGQMPVPLPDSYLDRVSARIVRMFELYSANINPDDQKFQEFIRQYVTSKDPKDPQTIPYSQLYKIVREGIREYMNQSKARPKK